MLNFALGFFAGVLLMVVLGYRERVRSVRALKEILSIYTPPITDDKEVIPNRHGKND